MLVAQPSSAPTEVDGTGDRKTGQHAVAVGLGIFALKADSYLRNIMLNTVLIIKLYSVVLQFHFRHITRY